MESLQEKANSYAEKQVIKVLKESFAKVYSDGYRDGYKDREGEIPIDLRDNKTEYVDLGLPSGTLWAKDYVKGEDGKISYYTYEEASILNIPTRDQWNELKNCCKWDFVIDKTGLLIRTDCAGPNGRVISFDNTGQIQAIQKKDLYESFYWIKEDTEGNDKIAVHIYRKKLYLDNSSYYFTDFNVIQKTFSGYKLPVRLVRKK